VASYPLTTLGLRIGSDEEWIDDLVSDRSINGSVKVRALYSGKKKKFLLVHLLNSAQRITLETFYDTNRLLVVTLLWPPDGVTYSCLFAKAPRLRHRSVLSDIDVELWQT